MIIEQVTENKDGYHAIENTLNSVKIDNVFPDASMKPKTSHFKWIEQFVGTQFHEHYLGELISVYHRTAFWRYDPCFQSFNLSVNVPTLK